MKTNIRHILLCRADKKRANKSVNYVFIFAFAFTTGKKQPSKSPGRPTFAIEFSSSDMVLCFISQCARCDWSIFGPYFTYTAC